MEDETKGTIKTNIQKAVNEAVWQVVHNTDFLKNYTSGKNLSEKDISETVKTVTSEVLTEVLEDMKIKDENEKSELWNTLKDACQDIISGKHKFNIYDAKPNFSNPKT